MINTLRHHGIIGMKWGIRRFQNADGSLTSEGKLRYSEELNAAVNKFDKASDKYKRAALKYKTVPTPKNKGKVDRARAERDFARRQISDQKIREKLAENPNKSARQLRFEEQYKRNGASDDEAAIQAYRRVRTEKALMVAGAVALTAAAAYVGYKQYDRTLDRVLRAGTNVQRITTNPTGGVRDAFYFSTNEADARKYRGLYGMQLHTQGRGQVYETKLGVMRDVKVASESTAVRALSDVVRNNPAYKQELRTFLTESSSSSPPSRAKRAVERGIKQLDKGRINTKVYDALNISLADHASANADRVQRQFYNELTSRGYGAIRDVNDKKFSGYAAKNPLIAFNNTSIKMEQVREVTDGEIRKNYNRAIGSLTAKALIPQGIAAVAAMGINSGLTKARNRTKEREVVDNYRKEHPNSDLSNNDILKNYYNY